MLSDLEDTLNDLGLAGLIGQKTGRLMAEDYAKKMELYAPDDLCVGLGEMLRILRERESGGEGCRILDWRRYATYFDFTDNARRLFELPGFAQDWILMTRAVPTMYGATHDTNLNVLVVGGSMSYPNLDTNKAVDQDAERGWRHEILTRPFVTMDEKLHETLMKDGFKDPLNCLNAEERSTRSVLEDVAWAVFRCRLSYELDYPAYWEPRCSAWVLRSVLTDFRCKVKYPFKTAIKPGPPLARPLPLDQYPPTKCAEGIAAGKMLTIDMTTIQKEISAVLTEIKSAEIHILKADEDKKKTKKKKKN
jgi:hypothetical protein